MAPRTQDERDAQEHPSEHAGDGSFSIVCLSTQPWDVALPTNRQQIMARAARLGHDVLFVDTSTFVGRHVAELLRGPNRGAKLRQLVSSVSAAPRVRTMRAPNLLPWGHRLPFAARVNAYSTAWLLRRRSGRRTGPTVLWIYDPCYADAIGRSGEDIAVYDCVDDYAEQSGGDERRRRLVTDRDRETARRARVVFATTTPLLERHRAVNPATHLVRNVGDFEHFAPAADATRADPALGALRRPVLGFAGNFLANKVDVDLLEGIARERQDWSVLLVGPAPADSRDRVEALTRLPNVTWTGPLPYARLPLAVAAFDVGLIPYLENAYTRSCFPLKTYEYLAAGKPVVATGLPELAGLEPHVRLARGVAATVALVEQALEELGPERRAARQAVAAQNTWETRASRLLELTAEALV
jgi:glycosyltransferase involved in cell wall biosynthesis